MGSQTASPQGSHNIIVQAMGDGNQVNFDLPRLELVPWSAEVRTDPRRDIDLLNPAFQAVPLIGRDDDLSFLRIWLEGGSIKITALIGAGGAGKTRLALAFLQQLPKGWDAGFLTAKEAKRFVEKANLGAWSWQRPTLIVVDYAAMLGTTLGEWFGELALARSSLHPLRILLLERHAEEESGWYQELVSNTWHGDRVRELFSPQKPRRLAPLNQENDRRALLAAGIEAAARLTGTTPVPALPSPEEEPDFDRRLGEPQWADPLLLLMAAVIGVANGLPQALSLSRLDLATFLAKREAARLRRSSAAGPTGDLLVHLYGCVILCGGLGVEEACALAEGEFEALRKPYPGGAGQAVEDLARLIGARDFPPSLAPDLLAEAFLLAAFGNLPRQGVGVISRVAKFAIERMVGVLVRTARDYGYGGSPLPLLWLKALLNGTELSVSALIAIEEALPSQSVHLAELAVEATTLIISRVQQLNPGHGEGDVDLALLLNNLSDRQSALGLRQPALESIQQAMAIYKRLLPTRPEYFLGRLAVTWNNLSLRQGDLGLQREAFESIQQAVTLYRLACSYHVAGAQSSLALSLNNLSTWQAAAGQFREAMQSTEEAIAIYRALAISDPDAFRAMFASTLMNLANHQSEVGLFEQALATSKEAVSMQRKQAAINPDAFIPDFAQALNNLATQHRDSGQLEEALACATEAVALRRVLIRTNPATFLPALASSLNNLCVVQGDLGLHPEALMSITEAVDINRRLSIAYPAAFRPKFAGLLTTLSNQQRKTGRNSEALQSMMEAAATYRELVVENKQAFQSDLARSLGGLSLCFAELERWEEARDAAAEALHYLAAAFRNAPDGFGHMAAVILQSYMDLSGRLGDDLDPKVLETYSSLIDWSEP